jgi:hypothetical protein
MLERNGLDRNLLGASAGSSSRATALAGAAGLVPAAGRRCRRAGAPAAVLDRCSIRWAGASGDQPVLVRGTARTCLARISPDREHGGAAAAPPRAGARLAAPEPAAAGHRPASPHRRSRGLSRRNAALAHFLAGYGNLENPVDRVLDHYIRHCAIAMSCAELAMAGGFFARHGVRRTLELAGRRDLNLRLATDHSAAAQDRSVTGRWDRPGHCVPALSADGPVDGDVVRGTRRPVTGFGRRPQADAKHRTRTAAHTSARSEDGAAAAQAKIPVTTPAWRCPTGQVRRRHETRPGCIARSPAGRGWQCPGSTSRWRAKSSPARTVMISSPGSAARHRHAARSPCA